MRLDIGLPVYRMQNFRTFTDQAEFVGKEGLPSDYFLAGQEVESIQQVQHDMLVKQSQRGSESIAIIYEVLKRDRQREPILITSTGVVVNGNRRLAAMRDIFARDSGTFPHFSHVDCAVLPSDATLADIVDIEAGLQAKQDTKLDYDWIGDAQLMSAMVMQHGGTAFVSKRTNRGEKDIRNTIQALAEADLYLKEWAESEGQYRLVREDAKQLFGDLPKLLEGKDEALHEASRVIAWTLYEARKRVPGRLYNYNDAVGKLAGDVMERLVEKLGVSTSVADAPAEEDFAVDFGEEEATVSYQAVIEQLRDPTTKGEVTDALIEAAQNALEVDKGRKSAAAPLNAVKDAYSKLMAVDVSRAAPDTHQRMKKQLEAIEQLTRNLIRKIDGYKGEE